MSARLSTFVYPWDLARLGEEQTLDHMAACGFDRAYLAATYHPVDALSPREGSLRLFASGRGAVHFPARPDRYGRIRPCTSSPEVCASWPRAAAAAAAAGIELVPWTIVLYQPWIVDRYPDCARVLPSGDRIDAGVCPANDDVRAYVIELCEDVVDQFEVSTMHLEGVAAPGFDYGWLRPRMLVDLPSHTRELLALCFCPSCRQRGSVAGIDVEHLRGRVNAAVSSELEGGPPEAVITADDIHGDADIQAFAESYVRASVELATSVAERLAPRGVRLSGMPWMPFTTLLTHDEQVYGELIAPFDQVLVRPDPEDPRTRVAMAQRSARGLELGVLVTPPRLVPPAASSGAPSVSTGDRTSDSLAGARAIEADEIAIYNYGLLRDVDVRQLTKEQT